MIACGGREVVGGPAGVGGEDYGWSGRRGTMLEASLSASLPVCDGMHSRATTATKYCDCSKVIHHRRNHQHASSAADTDTTH